jgi:hypothetical protein
MCGLSVNRALRRASILLFLGLSLSACSVKQPSLTASCSERVSTIYSGPGERSYCTTVSVPGTPITIFGEAKYEARILGAGGLTSLATGGSAKDIRYAEVEVLDASGNRVQCGQTNDSGVFSLAVPVTTGTYTVRVNSRSADLDSFGVGGNPVINASILNCPEEDGVYSITKTVTPSVDPDVGTITAPYNGTVVGAAFNIYDQFVTANIFLLQNAQAGNCTGIGCVNFTGAQKVTGYWQKGFNPYNYFGESADGISFYLPGYNRLFIMGGISGDVDASDTDHWDNAVILHEYGHFLEDAYAETDSPGGPHNGTSQIDPRLAWSEGWGNFIQGAIRGIACYTDTEGNVDGGAANYGYIFNVPLQNGTTGCADTITHTNFDVATLAGEGNFREFTITRFLYDIFDNDGDDIINNEFPQIWAGLTSNGAYGYNNTSQNFRSFGLMSEFQTNLGSSNWSTVRATHNMGLAREEYAQPVAIDSGAPTTDCDSTVGVRSYVSTTGGSSTADLLRRNDFFFYKHPGGALKLQLVYETGVGAEADVDLRLYREGARLFRADRADEVSRAELEPDGNIATDETETINLNSLAAGDYLVQVLIFTTGSAFTYDLKANTTAYPTSNMAYASGVFLCPP